MRIISCVATNFGSYKSIHIDPANHKLVLITGATGSGKSTIPDLFCWALYGVTAKNGSVEDVINWQASDEEPTEATIEVEINGNKNIIIHRARGLSSKKQNDLFWAEESYFGTPTRGKDISDTQRLLDGVLGIDAETFIASSYFHEFSSSGHFFMANAKGRRALLEKITDLSFPDRLQSRAAENSKFLNSQLQLLGKNLLSVQSTCARVKTEALRLSELENQYESAQKIVCQEIKAKNQNFEEDKKKSQKEISDKIKKLEALIVPGDLLENSLKEVKDKIAGLASVKCLECGGPKNSSKTSELIKEERRLSYSISTNNSYRDKLEGLEKELERISNAPNLYNELLDKETRRENPYMEQIETALCEIEEYSAEESMIAGEIKDRQWTVAQLERISDAAVMLKGTLLYAAVKEVETNTNKYLEQYFDSEIRISFNAESGDGVEVEAQKNGYRCNYKQLSKGQRGILKLCFAASIMEAAANKSGNHVNLLFFDEALDGLDTNLKVKSYRLFQKLAEGRDAVFVIDHSEELKEMFDNKYIVTMESDCSTIKTLT